jgi:transcriptional regulator with XRE-family HTH domain
LEVPRTSKREKIANELVRLLARQREDLGLSKSKLAERSGLSRAAILLFEEGRRMAGFDTLLRLCKGLDVNLWEVLRKATKSSETSK